ncbi:MAG TPA: SCO6880 family protein [Acidimicrobiales bacterium]|nr:SCO6880 family protein [Acidimicrobiales bacterium]
MDGEGDRYRFGPLERRGLVAGWRAGQIASVAVGLVVAVLVLRSAVDPATVAVAVVTVGAGVAVGCWPIGGRAGDEWLPTVVRWGAASAAGRRRWRSPAPSVGHRLGHRLGFGGEAAAPAGRGGPGPAGPFAGLRILEVTTGAAGGPAAVVHDARSGTYTAVLEVRGHSFALLGAEEKGRRVAGWAAVLSSLARERPVVHRLQWLATTLFDDGRAVEGFVADRATLPPASPARRSYAALLGQVGASTCRHEVHLAVQVRGVRPGRRTATRPAPAGARRAGDAAACAVLDREVAAIRRALADADVSVEGVLGPRAVATVLRRSGQPGPAGGAAVEEAGRAIGEGRMPAEPAPARSADLPWPWPVAVEEEWGRLRTDGTWQATYWIAEWPRVEVGPDFLGPLLLGSVRRTVSVVMQPLSPARAIRQAEQARTADLADAELRRRGGFLATARRSREADLAARREAELADGHAAVRFSGYVTVTAATTEELEEACDATEQAAGQCRLALRRLYGDQGRAFTFTLPLARGLR